MKHSASKVNTLPAQLFTHLKFLSVIQTFSRILVADLYQLPCLMFALEYYSRGLFISKMALWPSFASSCGSRINK
jgi:hypothetical protein